MWETIEIMVAVEKIEKKYGSKNVLKDISFIAHPGEKVAIIGRNGCGKSTLLKILAGIHPPTGGRLSYYGKEPLKQKKYFSEMCGYVPQENPLLEELSVKDNLKLWGGKQSVQDMNLRSMFELDEILKVPVKKLSGGMKRRVSIACAIAKWPSILIMDEPTSSVDLYYREKIHKWMDDYVNRNGIIIFSTHEEYEIQQSGRCLLMNAGVMQELQEEDKTGSKIYEHIKKGNGE